MNALTQTRSGLIGSAQDIEKLASAKKATLLVLSDMHCDNYELFLEVMRQFGSDADAMIYCGDGIRDIERIISEASRDEGVRNTIPPVLAVVKGNCDGFGSSSSLLDAPDFLTFKAAGRTVFAAHGHRLSVDFGVEHISSFASSFKANLIFYGHTHYPYKSIQDNVVVLNPGSMTRPRNGSLPSFAVVSYPGIREKFDVDFFAIKEVPFGHYQFSLISI